MLIYTYLTPERPKKPDKYLYTPSYYIFIYLPCVVVYCMSPCAAHHVTAWMDRISGLSLNYNRLHLMKSQIFTSHPTFSIDFLFRWHSPQLTFSSVDIFLNWQSPLLTFSSVDILVDMVGILPRWHSPSLTSIDLWLWFSFRPLWRPIQKQPH